MLCDESPHAKSVRCEDTLLILLFKFVALRLGLGMGQPDFPNDGTNFVADAPATSLDEDTSADEPELFERVDDNYDRVYDEEEETEGDQHESQVLARQG